MITNGPLRVTMTKRRGLILQGVFALQDQEGFPVAMSFELAKERRWNIDWIEALADAARQSVKKFESLLAEINLLEPANIEAVQHVFRGGLMESAGATFCEKAESLYQYLRRKEAA